MNALVDPLAVGQALPGARDHLHGHPRHPEQRGFRYLILDPTDETLAYAYVLGRDGGSAAAVLGQQRERRQPLGQRLPAQATSPR
jgi:hypothetical protein